MDPSEILRLQKLNETLKTVQQVSLILQTSQQLKQAEDSARQLEMLEQLRVHQDLVRAMTRGEREELRERADYDEKAWQEILKQLLA